MEIPATTALVGATSMTFGPPISKFLQRVGGPIADEIGEWGRDKIREYRYKNTMRAVERADQMLRDAEKEVKVVELRTLMPLLEGASREDNDDLATLWAALLANAANAEFTSDVPPIFPVLLGQLSPVDAQVLSYLWNEESSNKKESSHITRPASWGTRISAVKYFLKSRDEDQVDVTLDTLAALGLVQREPDVRMDAMMNPFVTGGTEVRLSSLGRRFIKACTPPSTANTQKSL